MVTILCPERMEAAKKHAAELNDPTLDECLKRMEHWAHSGKTVKIGSDFAPYSFSFAVYYPNGELDFNGGLLYHGSPDESFAVRIGDHKGRWSTHT